MNADGSGRTKLLDRTALDPAWSPDGKEIAFSLPSQNGIYNDLPTKAGGYKDSRSCGIYIMDADDSGKPRRLATGPECASSPAWSPDGKKIAYSSGEAGGGYAHYARDIYVTNASGEADHTNQSRALATYIRGGASDPSWSPDGTEITFTDTDKTASKTSIYKIEADGSGETPLAPKATDSKASSDWSPDGEQISYARGVTLRYSAIYIMNPDGSNPTLVRDFGEAHDVLGLDWKPLS